MWQDKKTKAIVVGIGTGMLGTVVAYFIYSEYFLHRSLYTEIQEFPRLFVTFRNQIFIVLGIMMVLTAAAMWLVISHYDRVMKRNLQIIDQGWKTENNTVAMEQIREGNLNQLQVELVRLIKQHQNLFASVHKEKEKLNSLVSDISHQLVTPITSIKLFADHLDAVDRQSSMVKERIEMETDRLEWLVSGLKNISQLETGLIRINMETRDISDTIIDAINTIYSKAKTHGLEIVSEGIVKSKVNHDYKWTKEAISNILDNCVKYAGEGRSIHLRTEESPISYAIHISDHGIGIRKEEIPRVFKRFYRSEAVRNVPGAGIGLYLSYEIMRKQRGTIDIDSKPGKGTTIKMIFFK